MAFTEERVKIQMLLMTVIGSTVQITKELLVFAAKSTQEQNNQRDGEK